MHGKQVVKSYFPPLRPSRHSTESTCPAPQVNGSLSCIQDKLKCDRNVTKRLPDGQHPGFGHLKPQPGVYRAILRRIKHKNCAAHADYVGVITLGDCKVSLRLWVHADGSLGLRLQKMTKDCNTHTNRNQQR